MYKKVLNGEIIGNDDLQIKVLYHNDDEMLVKVLKVESPIFGKYLELKGNYNLFRHQYWKDHLPLWEVDPDIMKQHDAELFLQWSQENGWEWKLDLEDV